MKVPVNWLKQYTNVDIPLDEYVSRMVMAGNGVEGVDEIAGDIEKVVVGKVESIRKHENSDHLVICQVNIGAETIQIVTGAPNVFEGAYVPVALDGAKLPGGKRIHTGKLRGELSQGMMCGGTELNVPNELYPNCGDEGLLIFHEEYPLGADVKPMLGIDDTVVDFEILANRPDCLSIWGIARETAAALNEELNLPNVEVTPANDGDDISKHVSIEVHASELCPRYVGRMVKNVRIAPSPMWLKAYLHAAGVRPISNIVDITNFIMLETGHPMHAFDLGKVRDGNIIVRRAHPGEELTTLDGKVRALDESMLVIADAENATGLAGIMGGEESEITEATHAVLFECAAFDRTSIRLTGRKLGMRTEASGRFERGVCPATAYSAIERACQLVQQLDAGDIVDGTIDLYPNPAPQQVITASIERISAHIGVDVPGEQMKQLLNSVCIDAEIAGDTITCKVPEFRMDMESYADIAEEVLRLYGYTAIPSTLMTGVTMQGGRSERQKLLDRVKEAMLAQGAYEIMTYSFISPHDVEKLGLAAADKRLNPVVVRNPLGEDTSVMRTTLVPSMLNTLAYNMNRGNAEALMFETAAQFEKSGSADESALPDERLTLAIGMYGEHADFYALRDVAICTLAHMGINVSAKPGADCYYHPGRSARIYSGDACLGQLGEIHPDTAERFELSSKRVYIAEIDLAEVVKCEQLMPTIKPLPKFPAVNRDIALIMDEAQPVGNVMDAIAKALGKLLEGISVFDVYRGQQIGASKKSVAFTLALRADHTLVEDEITSALERVLAVCEAQFGAVLREG